MRYACVLASQRHYHESSYFVSQAVQRMQDQPASSLLAVSYVNLAVLAAHQRRVADAVSDIRLAVGMIRHLPRLSNQWVQQIDKIHWLVLKIQELWPLQQHLVSGSN